MFAPIEYLDWYRQQPPCRYELGATDLRTDVPEQSALVPSVLRDLPEPASDASPQTLLAEEYGVAPGNIVLTSGARHAYVLAVLAALGRSTADPVAIIESPAFEPLFRTPAGFGAQIDRVERTAPDFNLDPAAVVSQLTDDAALVTITNRHNPSGSRLGREGLAEIAQAAAAVDALLISNEVYAPYTSEPQEGPFGGPTAAGLPATIVIGSVTKFHGVGEIRFGWMVVPDSLREALRNITMHFPTVGAPINYLARKALNAEELRQRGRMLVQTNHQLLREFLKECSSLKGRVHDGSTFAFLRHESADGDEVAAAAREAGIIVIPGRFFGDPARFRLGLGRDPEDMIDGLDRFEQVLSAL